MGAQASHPNAPPASGEAYIGTITSLRAGSFYCFITCPEVLSAYGKDAYCPVALLTPGPFNNGDQVEFAVGVKDGRAQAISVQHAHGAIANNVQASGQQGKGAPTPTGETYLGSVTELREGSWYCFITCPEVLGAYGKDAFCPMLLLPEGLGIPGSVVEFDVGVKPNGQPQAIAVRRPTPPAM